MDGPKLQVLAKFDAREVVRQILARPDAEAIVLAMLRSGSLLNEFLVRFVMEPTKCENSNPLAFAMARWCETIARIGDGAGCEALTDEAMMEVTPRLGAVLLRQCKRCASCTCSPASGATISPRPASRPTWPRL